MQKIQTKLIETQIQQLETLEKSSWNFFQNQ